MPAPTPQPKPAPTPTPPPAPAPPQDSGATPLTEVPKPRERSESKGIDEFFGGKPTPKPETPKVKPTPPAKADRPDEPFPPPDKPIPPQETASEGQTTKAEDADDGADLDSILESVKPSRKQETEQPPTTPNEPPRSKYDPKPLRDAFEQSKAEVAQLRKKLDELASSKGSDDLTATIEKLKAENVELSQRLEFADYRESPAFDQQFTKPLQTATEKAIEMAKKLRHQIDDRVGSPEDVYAIYQAYVQDPIRAETIAQEAFGQVASAAIMRKIEEMANIDASSRRALEEWKGSSSERKALAQAEATKHKQFALETFQGQWALEETALGEVLDTADNPQLGTMYGKVKKLVGLAFMPDGSMSPEQHYRHAAKVASMAATLPVVLAKFKSLQEENEKLRGEIAEYEGGNPRVKPTGKSEATKSTKHGLDAIDSYFNK